jgi:1-deoxy-D-xylulose-5-phosphate synthase
LLDQIDSPEALRRLPVESLPALAAEMRAELIEAISKTGGHLGSGLGVVEVTIALHYVHDFRHDRLVFDVGHQCYPHKMLTGRRGRMDTMRQIDGLCGFPHPLESDFDLFHTGHAGTSISLGLGLAVADKAAGSDRRTVVVIGDAGYGAGVAFEAMNAASEAGVNLLVILNDNEMSISRTVGAMSRYLTRVRTGPLVTGAKKELHELIKHIPVIGEKVDRSLRESLSMIRSVVAQGHVFEEFGFDYFGPMDGHDLARLVHTLQDLRQRPGLNLVHLVTTKGAGCELAADDPQRLHGVKPNPPGSGLPEKPVGRRRARSRPTPTCSPSTSCGARRTRRASWASPPRWPTARGCRSSRTRCPASASTSASASSTRWPSRAGWPRAAGSRSWRSTRPSCSAATTSSSRSCSSRTRASCWRSTAPGWSTTGPRTTACSTSPTCVPCRTRCSWRRPTPTS